LLPAGFQSDSSLSCYQADSDRCEWVSQVKSIEDKAAKTFILVLVLTINTENKEILRGTCRLGKQTRTECVMMLKKCFVIPFFFFFGGGGGETIECKMTRKSGRKRW